MAESPQSPTPADVDAAVEEYLRRVDAGEAVEQEAFIASHPAVAPALRSFFANEQLVRQWTSSAPPPAGDTATRNRNPTVAPDEVNPAALANPSASVVLPAMMGRYRVEKELGRGAMGAVYLARDTELDRPVALKLPHFSSQDNPDLIARFLREARSAAMLAHPNICRVYDVSDYQGTRYIAMEFIDGRPLSAYIRGTSIQPRQAASIVRKLALGLAEAHKQGIIHRDLKPDNILINKNGEPILTDFGLARETARGKATATQDGAILGSPAYMPPEQAAGNLSSMGPSSDVYSLGVVLYEMLTGELPFRGSVVEVLAHVLMKMPKPVRELRPEIDPTLAAICDKMMSKKAADRYQSMTEVAGALAEWIKSPQKSASPAPEAASQTGAELLSTLGELKIADEGKSKQPPAPSSLPPVSKTKPPGSKQTLAPGGTKKSPVRTARQIQELCQVLDQLLARKDYPEVIRIVEEIPEAERDLEMNGLYADAIELRTKVEKLEIDLQKHLNLVDLPALKKTINQLLAIRPSHGRARELRKALTKHGRQGIIKLLKEEGNFDAVGRVWDPWKIAASIATVLMVFAATSFAVTLYLKDDRRTVKVEIDDPTAVLKIDETVVSISGTGTGELKLKIGPHQWVVERNDEIIRGPQSFEVAKNGTTPLRITVLEPKVETSSSLPAATMDEVRAAIRAVILSGGQVGVTTDAGQQILCQNEGEIPAKDFTVRALDYLSPIDDAAVARLGPQLITKPVVDSCRMFLAVSPKFTSQSLTFVGKLTGLSTINVNGTSIDDSELKQLANLANLTLFYAENTKLTGAGLFQFANCRQLTDLNLSRNAIDDRGLANLPAQLKLTSLNLDATKITDASISHLQKFVSLKSLKVSQTNITASGLAQLRQNLPNCDINGDGPMTAASVPPLADLEMVPRLAGRLKVKQQDVGLRAIYPIGRTLSQASLAQALHALETIQNAVELELYGEFELSAQTTIAITHHGGSSNGGVAWLYLDERELGAVGDDRTKEAKYEEAVAAGKHRIRWRLIGGDIGASNLIDVRNKATGETVTVRPPEIEPQQQIRHTWGQLDVTRDRTAPEFSWDSASAKQATVKNVNSSPAPLNLNVLDNLFDSIPQRFMQRPCVIYARPDVHEILFDVAQDGFVILACNYDYQGNDSGGWKEKRWTADDFVKHGWRQLSENDVGGRLYAPKHKRNQTFFVKYLMSGDKYTLACNKYDPPYLIQFSSSDSPDPASQNGKPSPAVAPFNAEQAKAHQAAWTTHLRASQDHVNSLGMHFRMIPPGEFLMGASDAEKDKMTSDKELPRHKVRLTQPFYLSAHETTRGQFAQFVEETGYKTEVERSGRGGSVLDRYGNFQSDPKSNWRNPGFQQDDDHPVVNVTAADAQAFCRWLSEKEKTEYRLPTEAEWEFACRAGTTAIFVSGDQPEDVEGFGNFGDLSFSKIIQEKPNQKKKPSKPLTLNDGYAYTAPVGKFQPNPFGLHDMLGNVWEYCGDFLGDYPAGEAIDPKGPSTGEWHVGRGGGFDCYDRFSRAATRDFGEITEGNKGFRVAISLERGQPANQQAANWQPGFLCQIYDGRDFNRHLKTRVDRSIQINFGLDGAERELPVDQFSIRWLGAIHVQKTGSYAICLDHDDGGRLWIDDQQIFNNWTSTTSRDLKDVKLTAGWHTVRIDYYEDGATAGVNFLWSPAGAPVDQLVPIGGDLVQHNPAWAQRTDFTQLGTPDGASASP